MTKTSFINFMKQFINKYEAYEEFENFYKKKREHKKDSKIIFINRSRSRNRVIKITPNSSIKKNQIYVARLNEQTEKRDLMDSFKNYGYINDIIMKTSYAFIEFSHYKSAKLAIK